MRWAPGRSGRSAAALAGALLASSGCDVARIAARTSAAVSVRAAPGLEQFFDYEVAGQAMPTNIVQLEGMVRVDPRNDRLLLALVKSYVGYSYGWIEDRAEVLEYEHGDIRASDVERARAHRFYSRGRDLGRYLLSLHAGGGDRAFERGETAYRHWLRQHFERPREAAMLFYTGSAWASAIGTSPEGLSDAVDLPFARALVERSVELDPDFQSAAGLAFMGAIEAQVVDGDLERSRALFEDALERTDRQAFTVHVNMATTYAVEAGDRELYVSLLTEVLTAPDERSSSRLANLVARRRARRYLDAVDSRFH